MVVSQLPLRKLKIWFSPLGLVLICFPKNISSLKSSLWPYLLELKVTGKPPNLRVTQVYLLELKVRGKPPNLRVTQVDQLELKVRGKPTNLRVTQVYRLELKVRGKPPNLRVTQVDNYAFICDLYLMHFPQWKVVYSQPIYICCIL